MKQPSKVAVQFFNRHRIAPLFPDSAEGKLWSAVTELAVCDYFTKAYREDAKAFFTREGTIPAGIVDMNVLYEKVKGFEGAM